MATPDLAHFAATLRRLHILEPGQLDEVTRTGAFADAQELARELVRRGWLTAYQANQLFLADPTALVLGSYVLLDRLGEGGMGQVFKARHWKLGHLVALKVVRPDRAHSDSVLRRFRREIAAASKLHHPHIVRALDADEVDGTCLLTMEYVEGTDLARLVRRRGPLPVREACEYVRQAALGLQHAFEKGMVHRDVKPHNLLLARDGTVKVLDLGLARLASEGDDSSALTETGTVMGTPDYIAPEQARNAKAADVRADLYSLGCTLYFLLTGAPPFGGGSLTEKLLRHQMDPVPDVRARRADVPAGVARVVSRLLAKRPDERYQTPAELSAVLGDLLHTGLEGQTDETAPAREAEGSNTWAGLADGTSTEEPGRPTAAGARRVGPVVGAAFVGLLALGGLMAFLLRTGAPPEGATESSERGPAIVTVNATGGWQDTGVDVAEGERFRVTASGRWRKGDNSCGAGGLPDEPRDRVIVPAAPLLALLARVGDDPEPVPVPNDAILAPRRGRITLRANDLDPAGNAGALQATVGGGTRGPALPPPGPCLAESAEAAWQGLRPRTDDPAADGEALRRDLLAFRGEYAGAPQVTRANVALSAVRMRLPSPLDGLRRDAIPADDLKAALAGGDAQARDKLVALLGEPAGKGAVTGVAISEDDRRIATATADGSLIVWDAATGKELRRRTRAASKIEQLAFTPDGAIAFKEDPFAVLFLDPETGQELPPLQVDSAGSFHSFAVSPDGKILACGCVKAVRLFERATLKRIRIVEGVVGGVMAVSFAPDGRRFATVADAGAVQLWDVATGKEVPFRGGDKDSYRSAVFGPDGAVLALTGRGGTTRLVSAATGKERYALPPADGLAFRPDGQILAAPAAGAVRFWDVTTGREQQGLRLGEAGGGWAVLYAHDGRHLLAFDGKGAVHVLRLAPRRSDDKPRG